MPNTYRPRPLIWLRDVLVPLFVYSLMLAVLKQLAPSNFPLVALIFIAGCLLIVRNTVIPALRNRLQIDNHGLSGRSFRGVFEIPWSDVLAAWTAGDRVSSTILVLGTSQAVYEIPLKWLEAEQIWHEVRLHLPADIVTPAAQEKLKTIVTEYQENSQAQLLEKLPAPLRVGYGRGIKSFGWLGVVFFSSFALLSWQSGQIGSALCLLVFVILNFAFLLLTNQYLVMDLEGVSDLSILGHYRINWDEVTHIQTDPAGTGLIFHGSQKRVVVSGPAYWSGPDKEKMYQLLAAEIRTRNIEVKLDRWLSFKVIFSRNARVKKDR
jgi:hypothetical protein